MPERRELMLPSPDGGRRVHAVLWLPDGPPRGMVQLVHGLSEHILRYEPTALFLCAHGFAVCGHDHPGHGGSESDAPGFFAQHDGWELALQLVHALREHLAGDWPAWYLLGHSMGSFLVRACLIRWPGELTGALLSGTAQKPKAVLQLGRSLSGLLCAADPTRQSAVLRRLSMAVCNRKIHPHRTPLDWISRNPASVDAACADPLCRDFFPSAGLLRDMLDGMRYISRAENLARMDPSTPVYFFSGDRDPVGDYGRGVTRAAALFHESRDVTVRLYPGGRHEMLMETNADEVRADLLAWLEGHLP